MTITYTIIGIVVVLALIIMFLFNSLVRKKNHCKESWSGIEVQLKRRYNLIPNLVESVKGYSKHETSTFEKVTKARTEAMNAQGTAEKGKAENMLSSALKSLFAVAENYPELKANENYLHLQEELSDTEDKIQASRRFYNNTVKDFNTAIESVPTNVVAKMFNFKQRDFFELKEEEKAAEKPVDVKL